MTDTKALVERLRARRPRHGMLTVDPELFKDIDNAADALESQARRIEELEAVVASLRTANAKLGEQSWTVVADAREHAAHIAGMEEAAKIADSEGADWVATMIRAAAKSPKEPA